MRRLELRSAGYLLFCLLLTLNGCRSLTDEDIIAQALAEYERRPSSDTYCRALEATKYHTHWDKQWLALIASARQRNLAMTPSATAKTALALWRMGQILNAEELIAQIPADSIDHDVLACRIHFALANGKMSEAEACVKSLEEQRPDSDFEWFDVERFFEQSQNIAELRRVIKQRRTLAERNNEQTTIAYCTNQLLYWETTGSDPIRQIKQYGDVRLKIDATDGDKPYCIAFINGHGPYRLLVNSGAGNGLVLSRHVLIDAGIATPASNSAVDFHEGSHRSDNGIADSVELGGIRMEQFTIDYPNHKMWIKWREYPAWANFVFNALTHRDTSSAVMELR